MRLNALLALLVALASLVIVEMILRTDLVLYKTDLFFQHTHTIRTEFFTLTGDPSRPYYARPSVSREYWWGATYSTNHLGYLGDTISADGALNMIFLGDSVSFGLGVEHSETFPELIRNLIPRSRIATVAVPGYNTEHEVNALKDFLARSRFDPDIVVLQFGRNDLQQPEVMREEDDGYALYERKPLRTAVRPSGFYRELLDGSYLFFLTNKAVFRLLPGGEELYEYPDREAPVKRALVRLGSLALDYGATVVFLNVPNQRIHHSVECLFEHCIDLTELQNEDGNWLDTVHPSAQGHRFIARHLHNYLTEQGLVEANQEFGEHVDEQIEG